MSEGYKIASGWNVALGSLVDIETIAVSGEYFAGPKAIPLFDDGQVQFKLNRLVTTNGFESVTWNFGFLFYEQYSYLKSTYCNNTLSGYVTILTTLGGVTFSRMNATMVLKKPVEMRGKVWYVDPGVDFLGLEAAA